MLDPSESRVLELKGLVTLSVGCFTHTESKHLHQIAAGFQSHVQPSSAQRTPIINQPKWRQHILQSKAVTRVMDTLTALRSRPTSSTCERSSAQIRSATFMGCKHTQSRRQCNQRHSSHQRHPLSPDRPLATAMSSVYPCRSCPTPARSCKQYTGCQKEPRICRPGQQPD